MHDYLSLRFISPPRTIFKHIQKLPPAHTLVFKMGRSGFAVTGSYHSEKNWLCPKQKFSKRLREQLKRTVESHLISDVPVGRFLQRRAGFQHDRRCSGA